MSRQFLAAAALAALFSACSEYEASEPANTAAQPPQTTQPQATTPSPNAQGASAYGGAKRAAENVISGAQERSRQIAEEYSNPE